jgi:alpha-ribazole phosphatase/probable phosphoglycerate mutase
MSVKITYFVHGTTVDNENNISSGWNDAQLSALGVEQSEKLKELIEGVAFDIVYSSDLQRAVDSATITWGGSTMPIVSDARLRECNYGTYNGMDSEIVEPLQEKNISSPFPDGESYEEVKERIESFLEEVRFECDDKHIAIVAHKAPQLCLDVLLKGMTFEEAFANDWRKTKAWKPGWEYTLD